MNTVLIILGPTSTGKTDLALRLASLAQGELVSCDSRQVYKGLDIGTGKLPSQGQISNFKFQISNLKKHKGFWEINGIKVWMYDVADFKKQYTVYDYVQDAFRVIGEIQERGKLPIMVGGTGFYLKALLEGLPNLVIPVDEKLRKQLNNLTMKQLQQRLQELDRNKWEKMNNSDRQNSRRLIRAVEIVILSEATFSSHERGEAKDLSRMRYSNKLRDSSLIVQNDSCVLKIGLTASREVLYQRIDERVVDRINQGMVDEAKKLHKNGLTFKRMRQLGLEYGVLADYLENKIKSENDLIKILQRKIHGFARRQITWFKNEKGVFWFNITKKDWLDQVESKVNSWYYCGNDKKN